MLAQSTATTTQVHALYTDINISMPTELLPWFPIASINHTHRVSADLFAFLLKIFYPDHHFAKHALHDSRPYILYTLFYLSTNRHASHFILDLSPLVRFPSCHPLSLRPFVFLLFSLKFYIHIPLLAHLFHIPCSARFLYCNSSFVVVT